MDYSLLIDVRSQGISKVEADLQGLTVGMERTSQASDRLESSFRRVGNNERRLTSSNINRFSGSVRQANAEVSSLSRSMNTLSGLILSGVFIGMAKSCISAAQEVAGLKAQLRAIGEDADTAYNSLRDFSNTLAGLSTEGVVSAYSAFRRMNFTTSEAKDNIEALSKGLAQFGTSAGLDNVMRQLEQLSGKATGFTQDINAISNYLPNVRQVIQEAFNVSSIEDLYSQGITGRDLVNAITSHYSTLEAPVDDINMTMNRLNSSIKEIKANIGIAFEPMVAQLAKIVQIGAKISSNDWFAGAISSAAKFFGIVGGVALITKAFQGFNTVLQQTRATLQSLSAQSNANNLGIIANRLALGGPLLQTPVPQGALARQYRTSAEYVRANPSNLGSIREEYVIYRDIRNCVNQINEAEAQLNTLVGERNNLLVRAENNMNRRLYASRLLTSIDNELNSLSRAESENQYRIHNLQQRRLHVEEALNAVETERVSLLAQEESLSARIDAYRSVVASGGDFRSAQSTQFRNLGSSILNSPYFMMAGMMAGGYLSSLGANNTGTAVGTVATVAGDTLSYAAMGAMFGPLGAAIGGATGVISGAIKAINANTKAIYDARNSEIRNSSITRAGELRRAGRESEARTVEENARFQEDVNNIMAQNEQVGVKDYLRSGISAAISSLIPGGGVLEGLLGNFDISNITAGLIAPSASDYMKRQGLDPKSQADVIAYYDNLMEKEKQMQALQASDPNYRDKALEKEIKASGQMFTNYKATRTEHAEFYRNLEHQNEAEQRALSLEERQLDYQIRINDALASDDEFGAKRLEAEKDLQAVLENEESSEKEKYIAQQKYLLTLRKINEAEREHTEELQRQAEEDAKRAAEEAKRQKHEMEQSQYAYESNVQLVQGNRYLSELIDSQRRYNDAIYNAKNAYDMMNASIEKSINDNKAQLGLMQRQNKLLSTMDKYYGRSDLAEKRDLRTKRDSVLYDITADQNEKDNAIWEEKLSLLDRSINKIKQYYSFMSNLMQKQKEENKQVIDGAIANAKAYRDAVLGMFAEGKQAFMSSGYFDTSRPEYSDEELLEGAQKYKADKKYKEDLEARTDKLLFGGSTTYMDNVLKGLEYMNQQIDLTNATGLELLKILGSMAPYIQGSSRLFQEAYNDQMAF